MKTFKNILPGILLTFSIALISIYMSKYFMLSSKLCAIIIGFTLTNIFLKSDTFFSDGISFSEKTILSMAIILLGSQMNIFSMSLINYQTFLFILFMIAFTIIMSLFIGRFFGLSRDNSLLIGFGNAICGAAAIIGVSKLLNSKKTDIAISVAVINILGIFCIFLFPIFINFLPMLNNEQAGLLIGSTVQAFGQVTATGFIIGDEVGKISSIVKMIRISMLGPALIILNIVIYNTKKSKENFLINIPSFIIGFVILSLLVSFNILSESVISLLKIVSDFLLTAALAGISLNISVNNIYKNSKSIIYASSVSFLFQLAFAAILIYLLFFL